MTLALGHAVVEGLADVAAVAPVLVEQHTLLLAVQNVVSVNEDRKARMADKIIEAAGGDVRGKRIGILGVAFKPNTDDMRDAPSLTIVPVLQQAGATVVAYDPEAMDAAKGMMDGVTWAQNAYEVAKDADILAIVTEWNEFRALDLDRIASEMKGNILADLRNIYKPEELQGKNFKYVSVGRPEVAAEKAKVEDAA